MSNDDVIGPDDLDPEMMIVEEIDGDEIDPDALGLELEDEPFDDAAGALEAVKKGQAADIKAQGPTLLAMEERQRIFSREALGSFVSGAQGRIITGRHLHHIIVLSLEWIEVTSLVVTQKMIPLVLIMKAALLLAVMW